MHLTAKWQDVRTSSPDMDKAGSAVTNSLMRCGVERGEFSLGSYLFPH
jgi:hypothetical protein